MRSLRVEDLTFEVRRSRRRKTLQITVDRGGELILAAPECCPDAALEGFVRDKLFWIYTKLAEKDLLEQPRKRRMVSGEGFPYLGRSYRLLLVGEQDVPLKLERGRFRLRRADAQDGRRCFIRWYKDHARPWLTRRAARFAPRLGVAPPGVRVLDLGYRWGSCSQGGNLNFHWAVILLPPRIVEYVVVHELVHLHEKHHTRAFWTRLERALPDYQERRTWLARRGGAVVGW
ncbi:MAG: M48 family peptidase [Acidobacteria bacterium]|nr:MAG: M48 family peptidase [Acidobacteriota bacterium]